MDRWLNPNCQRIGTATLWSKKALFAMLKEQDSGFLQSLLSLVLHKGNTLISYSHISYHQKGQRSTSRNTLHVHLLNGPTLHEQFVVITLWEGLSCEEKHTIKSQAAVSDQTLTQPAALSCQRRLRLVLVHWSECLHSWKQAQGSLRVLHSSM